MPLPRAALRAMFSRLKGLKGKTSSKLLSKAQTLRQGLRKSGSKVAQRITSGIDSVDNSLMNRKVGKLASRLDTGKPANGLGGKVGDAVRRVGAKTRKSFYSTGAMTRKSFADHMNKPWGHGDTAVTAGVGGYIIGKRVGKRQERKKQMVRRVKY